MKRIFHQCKYVIKEERERESVTLDISDAQVELALASKVVAQIPNTNFRVHHFLDHTVRSNDKRISVYLSLLDLFSR